MIRRGYPTFYVTYMNVTQNKTTPMLVINCIYFNVENAGISSIVVTCFFVVVYAVCLLAKTCMCEIGRECTDKRSIHSFYVWRHTHIYTRRKDLRPPLPLPCYSTLDSFSSCVLQWWKKSLPKFSFFPTLWTLDSVNFLECWNVWNKWTTNSYSTLNNTWIFIFSIVKSIYRIFIKDVKYQ